MSQPPEDNDPNQDAKTLAGLAVAILLVVLTVFLMVKLKDGTKLLDCIASGRKNCVPIDTSNM
jgi:hypothetical protein